MTPSLEHDRPVLHAAAVRDMFDPAALTVSGFDASALALALIPFVESVTDSDGKARWSLRASMRAQILADSNPTAIRRSLDAEGPVIGTDRQRVFEVWIGGAAAGPRRLHGSVRPAADVEVEAVRAVAGWRLRDATWATPSAQQVLKDVSRRSLADGLRIAVGPHFVGRKNELARLGAVIDSAGKPRIVTVEALGGMGKSALVAQALIERGAFREDVPVIAAVLDFDAATIDPLDPASLFAALVEQLSPQVDGLRGLRKSFDSIVAGGRELARDSRASLLRGASDSHLLSLVIDMSKELARLSAQRPVIIVLDTVERALHTAGRLGATQTIRMLWNSLLAPIAEASLVLAGRTVPADLAPQPAESLRLGPLDAASSREVLESLGVARDRARRASEIVAGVPLTLRLAARVLRDEGDRPLDNPALRSAVEQARVNGYLYRRVLGHLPDSRLAKLADPGLMLRDLTADAIIKVLGQSVSPPVVQFAEAEAMIDDLARMEDLFLMVRGTGRPALRVRPEIRGDLIALLRQDRAKFNRFNAEATAYYRGLGTEEGNAAAAYHLLQLGRVDDALGVVGTDAALAEVVADAKDDLTADVVQIVEKRTALPRRQVDESDVERVLREASDLEATGRPALALEELLDAGHAEDSAWLERVAHLAGVTGNADALRKALATNTIPPVTAAIASDAAGIRIDTDLARRVFEEVATDPNRLVAPQVRAMLAVESQGGVEAATVRMFFSQLPEDFVATLFKMDPEVARRYVAQIARPGDLTAALTLRLLDGTRDLDLTPLLKALRNDTRAKRLVEEAQREDNLSATLLLLLKQTPSLDTQVFDLMRQSVQRPLSPSHATVEVHDRAGALDALVDWLVTYLDQEQRSALAREVIGSDVALSKEVEDDRRAALSLLYTIERRGRMDRFGELLVERYPAAASALQPALEMLREERVAKA